MDLCKSCGEPAVAKRSECGHSYCIGCIVTLREMIADWRGAGRAITGADNTVSWYKKNRDKQLMHPDTRKRVEELLWIKEE